MSSAPVPAPSNKLNFLDVDINEGLAFSFDAFINNATMAPGGSVGSGSGSKRGSTGSHLVDIDFGTSV